MVSSGLCALAGSGLLRSDGGESIVREDEWTVSSTVISIPQIASHKLQLRKWGALADIAAETLAAIQTERQLPFEV